MRKVALIQRSYMPGEISCPPRPSHTDPPGQIAGILPPTCLYLDNGLRVITQQMPVPALNVGLWVQCGSLHEPDAWNGMAHFLEHMVFKGTARLQLGEFERRVEATGSLTNAATSHDYTQYYITTTAAHFRDLAPLLMELVQSPGLPAADFEQERQVILEEIRRSQDHPQRRLFRHAMDVAFDRLPYRRPVLGPAEVVERLTVEEMRQFHDTWYRPAGLTAVAVGDLPVESLIETIAQTWGHLEPGAVTQPHWDPEPPFTQICRRDIPEPNLQQARLLMLWRVPGLNQLEETYPLDALAAILGQGRTARLVQTLREEKGWVTSIAAHNLTYRYQGVFWISAQLPVEHLGAVEAAILETLTELQTTGITDQELARVRRQVANRFVFANETPGDRAGLYGYYATLLNCLEPGLDYPERIQTLDPETLRQAAGRYLPTQAYGVVCLRPQTQGKG